MHPATVHATSSTRRGSPPPRRDAVWPGFARHRHATAGNKFRLLGTVIRNAAGHTVAVTDAQGNVTRNTWDGNGNLTAFTDAKGHPTAWTYDARNRPLTKTDALAKTETWQYDAAGNPVFHTDRKGQITGHQYDLLGRRTRTGYGATSTTAPIYQSTIDLTLDAGNRVTQLIDSANGTLAWTYDNRFDTVTRETTAEGSIDYTYRTNGQRQSTTPSGGPAVAYTYDAADRLTGIGQAAGTGPANPATAQNVTLAYDSANRRTSLTLPNGIRLAYAWDKAGQLASLTYRKADNSLIGDLAYTYDNAGQRTAIGGSLAATELPSTVATASHDANNRLTSWNGTPLSWDDNGNLLSDGTNAYTWNSRDQLSAIAGPVNASFQYDALGRRRSKTIGGVTTKFLYDGANPIQELNGTTVTANLLAGQNLDEWYGRTAGGATLTYLPDALGSTLKLTDATQAVTASYSYEPYGKTTVSGATGGNSLAYTGRENDGTGLYYYRARYYHPGLGRFIAEDPIGLAGGVNLFAYVGGNPVSYIDPLGLNPAAGAAAGGMVGGPVGAVIGGAIGLGVGLWVGNELGIFSKPPENARDPNGPKAPGKPGEGEGFNDPKGGENWVPNPNGKGSGWEDSKGDVWCPTGQGGSAHGGPHWDVQTPGGGYRNVRPRR